ncbi:hypothetical protein [Lewinella sp. IMCC34191]|uniref:hypothetical protein n=1 Tax=Lewinella sp. IMCC34191 TaxID=2259172 RepID=UPI000E227CE0|nr:hypothetical protein [Lewinella sp. IMCC34191]
MKHLYLPALAILLLLSACGKPLQVVRISPAAEQDIDRYRYGNPVQSLRQDEVTVEVSYYDASDDYLVFDAEVINESTEDILFDPVEAYLQLAADAQIPALDPEFQLLSMDLESVSRQRSARVMAWAGAAVLVAASAYAISKSGGSVAEVPTDATLVADLGIQVADAMTFAVLQQNQNLLQRNYAPTEEEIPAPDNRYFWLDYSFRKTTLRPGESAVGKLVFPRADMEVNFQLAVPVIGRPPYTFNFTQRIFRDRP